MSDNPLHHTATVAGGTLPSDWRDAIASSSDEPTREPVRLRRSRERRVVAGVAGGIAERFELNENLVRIILAALTAFWGIGVAIYIVIWVVVPLADPVATPRRPLVRRSTSHRLSYGVLASVVALITLAILVRRPLRILGSGLALAQVVFLVALAIIAIATPPRRLTLRGLRRVTLRTVLGVVLVGGAAMGFLVSTGVPLTGSTGDFVWQPTAPRQVSRAYHVEFGTGTLDLSAVNFSVAGSATSASVDVGELRIVVPANAIVSLTTNVGIGVVTDPAGAAAHRRVLATRRFTPLPAGASSAQLRRDPHLTIAARVGIGRIVLLRAGSAA